MTVKVKRIGGSVGVLIPKAMAQDMQLAEGTELELSAAGDAIVMRKQVRRRRRRRRSIASIVSQIKSASYRTRSRELRERAPVGKELW